MAFCWKKFPYTLTNSFHTVKQCMLDFYKYRMWLLLIHVF